MQNNFLCISTISNITGTEGEEHVAVFVACVFLDQAVRTEPSSALCVLSVCNNMFTVMVNSIAEKCVTPFNVDMQLQK
jgi:hypothetical protein